MQEMVERCNTN